jgi:hypothetical protein
MLKINSFLLLPRKARFCVVLSEMLVTAFHKERAIASIGWMKEDTGTTDLFCEARK